MELQNIVHPPVRKGTLQSQRPILDFFHVILPVEKIFTDYC